MATTAVIVTKHAGRTTGLALIAELALASLVLGLVWGPVVSAGIALLVARRGPSETVRSTVTAAAALVVVAAVATVLEAPLLDGWTLAFASSRPLAAGAASVAAVLAMGGGLLALTLVRSPDAAARSSDDGVRHRVTWRGALTAVAVVAALGGAVAAHLMLGPRGLEPDVERVAVNVAAGVHFSTGLPEDRAVAPLLPVLLVLTGFGARALGVFGALAVAGAAGALRRGAGSRSMVIACVAAAALPSVWAARLPVLMAAGLVGGALALLADGAVVARTGAIAAMVLGVALFADPTTILAGAGIAVWIAADRSAERGPDAARITFVLTYVLCVAVMLGTIRATGMTLPTWWRSGGPPGGVPTPWLVVDGLAGAAALAAVVRRQVPWVVGLVMIAGVGAGVGEHPGGGAWRWAAPLVAWGLVACIDDLMGWRPRPRAEVGASASGGQADRPAG